ncbi:MAG: transposase, partial [Anaerolineales bacterium]
NKWEFDFRKGIPYGTATKILPEFKARVVIEMLNELISTAQASREYGIKDPVVSRRKQELIELSSQLFEQATIRDDRYQRIAKLERRVGRLAMELVMVKKASR